MFAHKPSVGLVRHTLEYPSFLITIGPITVPINALRVLVSTNAFDHRIDRQLLAARERAASILAAARARIEHVSLRDMRRMLAPTIATLTDAGTAAISDLLNQAQLPPIGIRDAIRPGGPHTPPVKLQALTEHLLRRVPGRRLHQAITRGQRFATELAATIGDGVLLHPPLPTLAPRHRRTYWRLAFFQTMAIFNLAGLPVTHVPLGLGRHGLPLGVQVAAGPAQDHASIAVAIELERGFCPPSAH